MSVFSQSQYFSTTLSEVFTNEEPEKSAVIDSCIARNNGSAPARLDIYIVPNGGVADSSNLFYSETLSPGDSADCDRIMGSELGPNDSLWAQCSVATTIAGRLSGRKVTR